MAAGFRLRSSRYAGRGRRQKWDDLRGPSGRGRSTACMRAEVRLVANVWCEQSEAQR